MNDLLPDRNPTWRQVENRIAEVLESYGYEQVRIPILESTDLFARTIGEVTDIVEKEMYTFTDRNGDHLSLRPEGTAGVVRAGIEHGLFHHRIQRLWYQGPMFRHERPQRGRFRQFHQIGAELFGIAHPLADAETIAMTARFWGVLGVNPELQINTLGTTQCRARYRQLLVDYFELHYRDLDEDSRRRLTSNPLRILDSKNPDLAALIEDAPALLQHLDQESADHFRTVQETLELLKVPYRVNSKLVRGLDYYNHTVFEWISDTLGAQGTVCAGGRYDGLVEQLGGRSIPAFGFALGQERLVDLVEQSSGLVKSAPPDLYFIALEEHCRPAMLALAEQVRNGASDRRITIDYQGGGIGKQIGRAHKTGARAVVLMGPEELASGEITIKFLHRREQITVSRDQFLRQWVEWFSQPELQVDSSG